MALDDESIAVELGRTGLAIREGFLPSDVTAALLARSRAAQARGELRVAAVGFGDARAVRAEVRGDRTMWIDPAGACDAERAYFAAMEVLRSSVNECLRLGAFEVEAHYAHYAPGAAYARHSDRPRSSDARVVSTVLYLNEDWDERDGGALRIYLEDGAAREVLPRAGVFVAFLSEEFEHEVLAAARDRWSITAWLRRRA